MSIRKSGFVSRLGLLSTALLAFAGLAPRAQAQVVNPTLIPYTVSVIAGGGAALNGTKCPTSGFTATDTFGDGCLATEIALTAPRYAIADKNGNIFFSDYTNSLVRRIDATTGIVTAIAGGAASSPGPGACGTGVSVDALGDGCLGTAVALLKTTGLAFSAAGDLYFSESDYSTTQTNGAHVRKIAATGGLIPATGGIITLVAGNVGNIKGFAVNSASGNVIAATGSYLFYPYGLAFDSQGDLLISEEYKNAVLALNLNATGSTTVGTISIPAGTIAKIVGASGTAAPPSAICVNGNSSGTYGCSYNPYIEGAAANADWLDSPYGTVADTAGNLYIANEFDNSIPTVSATTGILTTYAGIEGSNGVQLSATRGTPNAQGIGSPFGVTIDAGNNVYFTDALNGVVWRADSGGKTVYVVAGGGTPGACAVDAYGDGCPATQATFGSSVTSVPMNKLYAVSSSPGIFGITVDQYSNLYVGDTITNLIREVSSGTQFGNIGANQPTQTIKLHFGSGDSVATESLTAGATNFSLGTIACGAANSDGTKDCTLAITATPAVLGAFTGTLTVTSTAGGTAAFPLNGNFAINPASRVAVSVTGGVSCSGTPNYTTTSPLTATALLTANGPSAPGGMITFSASITTAGNSTPATVAIGIKPVVKIGNAYGASINYTPTGVGSYVILATYSGDSYFAPSTGSAAAITASSASIAFATPPAITGGPTYTSPLLQAPSVPCTDSNGNAIAAPCVAAGQTALYSLNLLQTVYTGTVTFSCSGLPSGASCSFSPSSVTATGCSANTTVAVSVNTSQAYPVTAGGFGAVGGGPWQRLGLFGGLGLALLIGLRRRRVGMRYGQLWMALALLLATSALAACNTPTTRAATPASVSTITVTATGPNGAAATYPLSLTVYSIKQ